MSGLLMGRAFYAPLPQHLKLTLLALCDVADDDGTGVFIGQARLAVKVGASERSVGSHVRELRELGLIEKLGRRGSHGQDVHRVVVERLPGDAEIRAARRRPEADRRPADVADRQLVSGRPRPRPETQRRLDRKPASSYTSETRQGTPLPLPRRPDFDALATSTGCDLAALTRSAAATIGTKLAEIRDAERQRLERDPTPHDLADEIRARAARFRRRHPTWDLTPGSLAKYWPTVGPRDVTGVEPAAALAIPELSPDEAEAAEAARVRAFERWKGPRHRTSEPQEVTA